MRRYYSIDGVGVPRKIWERRQVFGEYSGARFEVTEKREPEKKKEFRRSA